MERFDALQVPGALIRVVGETSDVLEGVLRRLGWEEKDVERGLGGALCSVRVILDVLTFE